MDRSWGWLLKRLLWSTLSTGLGPIRPMVVVEVGDVAGSAAGTGRPKELADVRVPVATPPSRTRRCCRRSGRCSWRRCEARGARGSGGPELHARDGQPRGGETLLTRSRGGAWPRDAAADTHKQAGRQSTALTRASSSSCHVTKRFRILATLKQGNKRMYSSTSGYVHMGLRLDWSKGITGQYTLSPNSYPNPRSDPLSG